MGFAKFNNICGFLSYICKCGLFFQAIVTWDILFWVTVYVVEDFGINR
jgi:hypothetical protein